MGVIHVGRGIHVWDLLLNNSFNHDNRKEAYFSNYSTEHTHIFPVLQTIGFRS